MTFEYFLRNFGAQLVVSDRSKLQNDVSLISYARLMPNSCVFWVPFEFELDWVEVRFWRVRWLSRTLENFNILKFQPNFNQLRCTFGIVVMLEDPEDSEAGYFPKYFYTKQSPFVLLFLLLREPRYYYRKPRYYYHQTQQLDGCTCFRCECFLDVWRILFCLWLPQKFVIKCNLWGFRSRMSMPQNSAQPALLFFENACFFCPEASKLVDASYNRRS